MSAKAARPAFSALAAAFAPASVIATSLALAACTAATSAPPVADAVPAQFTPQKWAAACAEDAGWDDPGPPFRIHGNSWYVGTCGIAAVLITGADGHVLIDSGTEKGAEVVAENIRTLGFRLEDVKILLMSHEHHDHSGGMARLKTLTGAQFFASPEAAAVMASGTAGADDPQFGINDDFPPVTADRVLEPDGKVQLGSLMLTALRTPGHTPGALSWQWQSCATVGGGQADCRSMVYADSLSAFSNDEYRYGDHPAYVTAFREGLDRVERIRCDMLITPHPSASGLHPRAVAGLTADSTGCARYAREKRAQLDARLAKESGQ